MSSRYRWAFDYAVEGDLRFISHHDTLRLFRRALVRAAVPVCYSQGFNPHPRVVIPLPRPVGVASDAECVYVETDAAIDLEDVLERLRRQMPAGIRLLRGRHLETDHPPQPDQVRYRLDLSNSAPADLEARVREILDADVVEVRRLQGGRSEPRSVDVRPYIVDFRVTEGAVEFTLRVTSAGSAKPAEIAGLIGFDVNAINHRICRMEVRWRS